jgi:DNA-binding PadR family transcriptional regulator
MLLKKVIRYVLVPRDEARNHARGEEKGEERTQLLPLLSPKEACILQLLVARPEMYGLALVDASEGELKRGTVYVTLNRMEEKGYIESRKDPGAPGEGPTKRMYKATGYGLRVLMSWLPFRTTTALQVER